MISSWIGLIRSDYYFLTFDNYLGHLTNYLTKQVD